MYRIKSELKQIPLKQLRPTQMTVGFREVKQKRMDLQALGKKKRQATMAELLFPAVCGPEDAYFILDHHHLALALEQERAKKVRVGVVEDFSDMSPDDFWIHLDHLSWVHPYDARGKRRPFEDLPRKFPELADDPYRSLAGDVRHLGGFAKSDAPFLEFLWANFFRARVDLRNRNQYRAALRKALHLAHGNEARNLPGWVGGG